MTTLSKNSIPVSLSIVIPTFGREAVLCDTIRMLLKVASPADEIIIVDQTAQHETETDVALSEWQKKGQIRWIKRCRPSITEAMNQGVLEARGDLALFLDDDIIPCIDLIKFHRETHAHHPEAWAVVGQVLQPEDWGEIRKLETRNLKLETGGEQRAAAIAAEVASHQSLAASGLRTDLNFKFNSTAPSRVQNVMAGNLSVNRERFLELGGFDENFTGSAYRFETEFAKRLIAAGGLIRYEPAASIRHLRASAGGTRSRGSHMTSASPRHGMGDYYYALQCGRNLERIFYMLKRPFREVRTKFHLSHPWWIPIKLIGELRAMRLAIQLYRQGAKLINKKNLHLATHC